MEREAVGLDHCELAELILKQWNIPASITGPVRYQHDFDAADPWRMGAAILSLSRGVCREWKVGLEHPIDVSLEISPELFSDEMEEIGLDESRWNSVRR